MEYLFGKAGRQSDYVADDFGVVKELTTKLASDVEANIYFGTPGGGAAYNQNDLDYVVMRLPTTYVESTNPLIFILWSTSFQDGVSRDRWEASEKLTDVFRNIDTVNGDIPLSDDSSVWGFGQPSGIHYRGFSRLIIIDGVYIGEYFKYDQNISNRDSHDIRDDTYFVTVTSDFWLRKPSYLQRFYEELKKVMEFSDAKYDNYIKDYKASVDDESIVSFIEAVKFRETNTLAGLYQRRRHEVSHIQTLMSNLLEAQRNLQRADEDIRKETFVIRNSKNGSNDRILAEYRAIKNIVGVKEIFVDRSGYNNETGDYDVHVIHVITGDVISQELEDGSTRNLGRYEIKLYADMRSPEITRMDSANGVNVLGMTFLHPHISDGGVCWGNISTAVVEFASNREYAALVGLIMKFLSEPNSDDEWGKSIWAFPVESIREGCVAYDASYLERYDENSEYCSDCDMEPCQCCWECRNSGYECYYDGDCDAENGCPCLVDVP